MLKMRLPKTQIVQKTKTFIIYKKDKNIRIIREAFLQGSSTGLKEMTSEIQ